jgi:hypothetical protein
MKKMIPVVMVLLVAGAVLLEAGRPAEVHAAGGRLVKEAVEETIEVVARKFGIKLGSEAGERFGREAAEFVARHGDDGAKALRATGPQVMEMAARHGDEVVRLFAAHTDEAARFLAHHVDDALPVWRSFGREGTEVLVRHPGLGKPLLDACGQKGLEIGRRLDTAGIQRFLNLQSKVKGQAEKATLTDAVLKEGQKVVDFLWQHKYKLAAGYAVHQLLADYRTGGAESGGEAAKHAAGPFNFMQEWALGTWKTVLADVPYLTWGIGLAALYVIIKAVLFLGQALNWIGSLIPRPKPKPDSQHAA